MEIRKAAGVLETGSPSPEQLEKINAFAKTPLTAEEVYVFAVRLCDDQPDRDLEQFSPEALRALAPMFLGKTGILDHAWQSDKQLGRIFDAEVQCDDGVNWLKAWVYMLRGEKTAELIREIEGGIKKEVSVGCSMGRTVCSVCGADYGACEHRKGVTYDGKLCVAVLCEPVDAYEFSFVAVPAQREAGVVKAADPDGAYLAALSQDAALGRSYRKQLQKEIVRLGLVLELGLDQPLLESLAKKLDGDQLQAVQSALSEKAAKLFPPCTQLSAPAERTQQADSAFLI